MHDCRIEFKMRTALNCSNYRVRGIIIGNWLNKKNKLNLSLLILHQLFDLI